MAKGTVQNPPKSSPGYPIIEKLIETEDFTKVNKTISASYDSLERMQKHKSGGLKKQKTIRQALKAYDLTIDLIRDLLKTKHELLRRQKGKIAAPKEK